MSLMYVRVTVCPNRYHDIDLCGNMERGNVAPVSAAHDLLSKVVVSGTRIKRVETLGSHEVKKEPRLA